MYPCLLPIYLVWYNAVKNFIECSLEAFVMGNLKTSISKWIGPFVFALFLMITFTIVNNFDVILGTIRNFLSIISPFIIGIVIAYFLNVPCTKIADLIRKVSKGTFIAKRSRGISVLIIYISLILIISAISSYVVPIIITNLTDLLSLIPQFSQVVMAFIADFPLDFIDTDQIMSLFNFEAILANVASNVASIGQYAAVVTSGIINTFLSIIISVYVLLYKDMLLALAGRLVRLVIKKESSFNSARSYMHKSNEIFYTFIYTQFLDACILGTLATIMLTLLGVPYALTFGLLLGVGNMIPYFGSIVASVITTVITIFTGGVALGAITGASLLVLQQIDGNIIGPRLMGNSLRLNPIWIIFSITVGGAYFGVIGMFVSVPIAAMLKVVLGNFIEVYEKKHGIVRV